MSNSSLLWQVAGLPTNIDFLFKLADHWAFANGDVETHFIERFRSELFVDPTDSDVEEKAYDAARLGATLVAACLCTNEISSIRNVSGKKKVSSYY